MNVRMASAHIEKLQRFVDILPLSLPTEFVPRRTAYRNVGRKKTTTFSPCPTRTISRLYAAGTFSPSRRRCRPPRWRRSLRERAGMIWSTAASSRAGTNS